MTEFRTKGRGKSRKIYPIGRGKSRKVYSIGRINEHKKDHSDFEENPPEEEVLEERMQEQKTQKKHKPEKPSFSTRSNVHLDIKKMMQKDDASDHGKRDYKQYKTKLRQNADKQYHKESRKAEKKQKKEQRKEEKQQEREQEEIEKQQECSENNDGHQTIS